MVNLPTLADQGDIDNVIILPTPLSDIGDTTSPLQKRLEFAVGEAMIDLGILPLAPDFLSIPSVESGQQTDIPGVLRKVAAQHTGRLLAVEIDLLSTAEQESHQIPAASVIDIGTGRLVARTSTLPLLEPDDRLEITASAAALVIREKEAARAVDAARAELETFFAAGGPHASFRIRIEEGCIGSAFPVYDWKKLYVPVDAKWGLESLIAARLPQAAPRIRPSRRAAAPTGTPSGCRGSPSTRPRRRR